MIILGIIVSAAADELLLDHPSVHGSLSASGFIVGGSALSLAGHAIFKAVVWRLVSWPRVVAAAVLLPLLLVAPHISALTLAIAVLAVVIVVAVADRMHQMAA